MLIKQFSGATIDEVLTKVREELGEDAVILQTKRVVTGGIGGFFGREGVEVTAAEGLPAAEGERANKEAAASVAAPRAMDATTGDTEGPEGPGGFVPTPFGRHLDSRLEAAAEVAAPPAQAGPPASATATYARVGAPFAPGDRERTQAIIEAARAAVREAHDQAAGLPADPGVPAAAEPPAPQPPAPAEPPAPQPPAAAEPPAPQPPAAAEPPAPQPPAPAEPPAPQPPAAAEPPAPQPAAPADGAEGPGDERPVGQPPVGRGTGATIDGVRSDLLRAGVDARYLDPFMDGFARSVAPFLGARDGVRDAMREQAAGAPAALGAPATVELPAPPPPAEPAPPPPASAEPPVPPSPAAAQVPAPPRPAPADETGWSDDERPVGRPRIGRGTGATLDGVRSELLRAGVDARYLDPFIDGFARSVAPFLGARDSIRDAMRDHLSARLPVGRDWRARPSGHTVAFVGQSGVGKTSAAASLAGRFRAAGLAVAVVAAGAGRHDGLEDHARRLDVQIFRAADGETLARVCSTLVDRDLVIVDTVGRSHQQLDEIEDLAALLAPVDIDEVHLVLPLATPLADLGDVQRRFRLTGVNRLSLTKLDETRRLGNLVNVPLRIGKPLVYLSDGTAIPGSLAPADGRRVAEMILP